MCSNLGTRNVKERGLRCLKRPLRNISHLLTGVNLHALAKNCKDGMLRRGSIGLVLRLRGKRDGKTASSKDQTELSATEHGEILLLGLTTTVIPSHSSITIFMPSNSGERNGV
jgi:hypothetical protein